MSSMVTHAIAGYTIGAVALAVFKREALETRAVKRFGGVAAIGLVAGIIPDLDVFPLTLRLIKYHTFFGHRGFFHSPLFYLGLAPLWALFLCRAHVSSRRWAWLLWTAILFAALLSHSVLDALTDGGLGVMLYFPWDSGRHFFAWQPIRVAPISLTRFLSSKGVEVLLSEAWFFVPMLVIIGLAKLNTETELKPEVADPPRDEARLLRDFVASGNILSDDELSEIDNSQDQTSPSK